MYKQWIRLSCVYNAALTSDPTFQALRQAVATTQQVHRFQDQAKVIGTHERYGRSAQKAAQYKGVAMDALLSEERQARVGGQVMLEQSSQRSI